MNFLTTIEKRRYILATFFFIFAIYCLVALYASFHVYTDNKEKKDAIIVLGAKATFNGKDNPCLVARVHHGVELFKNGYGNMLIFSGGNDESHTMKKIAEREGVKKEYILEEDTSTSTYENFKNSLAVMEKNNLDSLIIVTEPFHSPRASLVADAMNLEHTVSPAVNSPCWTRWKFLSRYFLREPFAIIGYKLQGKL